MSGSSEGTAQAPPAATTLFAGVEALAGSLPSGALIGRYLILRKLGEGGMGTVYVAFDPELDRQIALKLVSPGGGREARERLLREAQALARLSHPNVVAVHDVGVFGELVFVAMELVRGEDLRTWLDRKRSQREVLRVMVEAGLGLVAAHQAGLVHRDFKPANVLVGSDGRVRVADFGLARATEDSSPRVPAEALARSPSANLTQAGAVMGTPAYMAPEQIRGEVADARADQFSFCLVLHEALCGRVLFGGRNLKERLAAIEEGPADDRLSLIPRWLRRIVARGVDKDPDRRHPALTTLVDRLQRVPARRRALALGGAVTLAMAVGLGAALWLRSGPTCAGVAQQLSGVWGPAKRAEIQTAFARTGLPYAARTFRAVRQVIDAYAKEWIRLRLRFCDETRVRRTVPPEVMNQRNACLDERRRRLHAHVSVLALADATTVQRADRSTRSLLPLRSCATAPNLRARRRPLVPKEEIEGAMARVARARALLEAGHYQTGLTAAKQVYAQAKRWRYRPLIAEAGVVLGRALDLAGDYPKATDELAKALSQSLALGEVLWVYESARHLGAIEGLAEERFDDARRWLDVAKAALERGGGDHVLEADLERLQGRIYIAESRPGEALVHLKRARLLLRGTRESDGERVGRILLDLAMALGDLDRPSDAATFARRAFDFALRGLGPAHPRLWAYYAGLARVHRANRRLREAREAADRALEIARGAYRPGHPERIWAQLQLSGVLRKAGRFAEAAELAKRTVDESTERLGTGAPTTLAAMTTWAVALREASRLADAERILRSVLERGERRWGSNHLKLAAPIAFLGDVLQQQGRFSEAKRLLARSLAIRQGALGSDHTLVATSLNDYGDVLLESGEAAASLDYFRRARAIWRGQTGARAPVLALPTFNVGEAYLRLGRFPEAVEALREALAIQRAATVGGPDIADTLVALSEGLLGVGKHDEARVRVEEALAIYRATPSGARWTARALFASARALGATNATARERARKARQIYLKTGGAYRRRIRSIDAWLRGRRRRP